MDLKDIDWTQDTSALINGANLFEERLNRCGFVHAPLWMFALRDVLHDVPRVLAKLATVITVADPVVQTPKLLDNFETYVLYAFLPHLEYHFAGTNDPQLAMLLSEPGTTNIPEAALERRLVSDVSPLAVVGVSIESVTSNFDLLLAASDEFASSLHRAGVSDSLVWFSHVQAVLNDIRQMMAELVSVLLTPDPCSDGPRLLQTYVLEVLNQLVPRMKQHMEALEAQLEPLLAADDATDEHRVDTA